MMEKKKTLALASDSDTIILSTLNTDVKHLQELKNAALDYVSKGYPIVPMGCNQAYQDYKLPLIRWQSVGPLRTSEEVSRSFNQLQGKIFGIATIVDGYTLVDFDTPDTDKLFNIPPTPTIKTGKGYHLWYAADDTLNKNGPVDLSHFEKRDGKKYQMEVYTKSRLEIIPPSLHHSGIVYEWLVSLDEFPELPELPEDIKNLCTDKGGILTTPVDGIVSEGSRHSMLMEQVKKFGRMHRGNKEKIERAALSWNTLHCLPQLSPGEVIGMTNWVVENYKELSTDKEQSKAKKLDKLLNNCDVTELFHDQGDVGYARIRFKGRTMNVPIKSTEFKDFVRYAFYKENGESVSSLILDEALGLCSAKALYDGDKHPLFHRVAQVDDCIYYDLMNSEGEIVKIDESGWSIMSSNEMPFLFKTGCGEEQVRPIPGGDLKELLDLVNIADTDEQMLFISTLPVRLIREVDQAIVYVYGPAGSGKTTLLKMAKNLLDPSAGGISMPIKKVEDAIPLLSQTWVFANDNISRINNELSDFLCVVATGAENSRRTLYTNGDLTVFSVKNPAYLTGVNIEAYRSDLMSRMLLFKTKAVSSGERLGSKALTDKFTEMKPLLLGALFDTLSKAINEKKKLPQNTEFRMADFSLWGAACAQALGYGADCFEKAMQKVMKYAAYDAIYSLSAGRALLELLEKEEGFRGTASELLNKLKNTDSGFEWNEEVAKNPATLGKKLRELENSLMELGIAIDYGKRSSSERIISIRKVGKTNDSMTAVTESMLLSK